MPRPRIDSRALGLGLVAVVIGGLAIVSQNGTDPDSADAEPPVQSIERAPASTTPGNPNPQATPAGSWLDGDWEIIAYTDGELVRVDLGNDRVARTPINGLNDDAPVSLIAGTERVLVRSLASEAALVVDDRPARRLPGPVGEAALVLPGPEQDQLWLERRQPDGSMELIPTTWGGRPLAPAVRLPARAGSIHPISDHRGAVIVSGTSGTYRVDKTGPHRITRGDIIGAGPTHLVVKTCDDVARCRFRIIDRDAGDVRELGPLEFATPQPLPGVISAGGRYLAIRDSAGTARLRPRLIDLRTSKEIELTGADHELVLSGQGQNLAWSPDGRWLLVANDSTVLVINPRTGYTRPLDVRIPGAEAITVRE